MKVCISAGHSKIVRGAAGSPIPPYLDEFDENCRVVQRTTMALTSLGVETQSFIDMVSQTQDENLARIVDWHNNASRDPHDLDVSVHFNSSDNGQGHGCEVFYASNSGKEYATTIVNAICEATGFTNRGPKEGNLYFLSNTREVAVLVEVCFCNNTTDCSIYRSPGKFDDICEAIAEAISGEATMPEPIPPPGERPVRPPPSDSLFVTRGTCSWFGGPDDDGVSPSEGLAFYYEWSDQPELFLPYQPQGTTGLARRLNPQVLYVACRWDYAVTPKDMLRTGKMALVRANGWELEAFPADWGPHEEETGRAADLSPGLMRALGITTDDEVEVIYPAPD